MTFRETMNNLLYVYVLHDIMMNGWFIINSRFRLTLELICVSLHMSVELWLYGSMGTGADR